MMRFLLTVLLPLLVPLMIYAAYLVLAQRKARLAGEGRLPRWQTAPWGVITVSALVLMLISLGYWRFTSGVAPGVKLEPPRLKDGRIVPSHPIEQ